MRCFVQGSSHTMVKGEPRMWEGSGVPRSAWYTLTLYLPAMGTAYCTSYMPSCRSLIRARPSTSTLVPKETTRQEKVSPPDCRFSLSVFFAWMRKGISMPKTPFSSSPGP